jgi:ZIP family zinc transporter
LGVSFGGISDGAEDGTNRPTLNDAILLTIAMALQNLPEGLAISVPLRKAGLSRKKSFCLGQLSGAVEVLGALLGAAFVLMVQSILPYALTFAAGT